MIKKRKWTFKPFLATKDDEDSRYEELIELQKNLGIEIVCDWMFRNWPFFGKNSIK